MAFSAAQLQKVSGRVCFLRRRYNTCDARCRLSEVAPRYFQRGQRLACIDLDERVRSWLDYFKQWILADTSDTVLRVLLTLSRLLAEVLPLHPSRLPLVNLPTVLPLRSTRLPRTLSLLLELPLPLRRPSPNLPSLPGLPNLQSKLHEPRLLLEDLVDLVYLPPRLTHSPIRSQSRLLISIPRLSMR